MPVSLRMKEMCHVASVHSLEKLPVPYKKTNNVCYSHLAALVPVWCFFFIIFGYEILGRCFSTDTHLLAHTHKQKHSLDIPLWTYDVQ